MCGRYALFAEDELTEMREILAEINRRYGNAGAEQMGRGEIFPTNRLPVLAAPRREREALLLKWGFPRPGGKGVVINARSETAARRGMFRDAFQRRRCLVPASGYYEWKRDDKTKFFFRDPGRLLYMAGLYREEEGGSFVILTREAAPDQAFIHERMPVILPRAQQRRWLLAGGEEAEEILGMPPPPLAFDPVG